MALGGNIDRIERNIESIESKFAKIFKRPKNRDGSDFDDFWTESMVSTQSIFAKILERTKRFRKFRKLFKQIWIFCFTNHVRFIFFPGPQVYNQQLVLRDRSTLEVL